MTFVETRDSGLLRLLSPMIHPRSDISHTRVKFSLRPEGGSDVQETLVAFVYIVKMPDCTLLDKSFIYREVINGLIWILEKQFF